MFFSLALILLCSLLLSGIFTKFRIPGLLGMLLVGILFGPYAFNLISTEILDISEELRGIALIIILLRAGLALDLKDLAKVGRPSILMCFVPAMFELVAVTLLAPLIFGVSYLEAAIMGAVLAAVSPAVIVPRMLKLMKNKFGTAKNIPQLVMAGSSVDDVFVIVVFTALIGMYKGGSFDTLSLLAIPVSILSGLVLGVMTGRLLLVFFKKFKVKDAVELLIILSTAFLFVSLETAVKGYFPISGLLAVMALGGTILKYNEKLSTRISGKFSKLWVGAEILLFVLVGAIVNVRDFSSAGVLALLLIFGALAFRILGVFTALLKTKLNRKERLFCAISYVPKGTVQAAIAAIPLSAGVASGNLILSVAVLAIIITASVGALAMDFSYKSLLKQEDM